MGAELTALFINYTYLVTALIGFLLVLSVYFLNCCLNVKKGVSFMLDLTIAFMHDEIMMQSLLLF